MIDDIFSQRGRALEEAFFSKRNQDLLQKLRADLEGQERKKQLAEVSGIREDSVLTSLVEAGVTPEAFTAVTLIPLILVAWADDFVDAHERKAILKAAQQEGICEEDAACQLLESWIREKPDDKLLGAWKAYIAALRRTLAPESIEEIKEKIVRRARRVARAAGGILGVATVTKAEQEVISALESAFGAD